MAKIRQSRPDSGLGFQVKAHKPFSVVPSSFGSGGRIGIGGFHSGTVPGNVEPLLETQHPRANMARIRQARPDPSLSLCSKTDPAGSLLQPAASRGLGRLGRGVEV